MKNRSIATMLVVLAALAISLPALGQAPLPRTVAALKQMEGTVLVSQGDAMAAGTKDQRLRPDTRIVTTAGASVTVSYDNGCDVRLTENQRFIVREFGSCPALAATVESLGGGIAGAGAAGAAGGINAAGLLVGAGVIYLIVTDRTGNVSPN